MCCSIHNVNNIHLKMYDKVEIPKQKLIQVNTIYYDMKQYQFKTNMVNFTYVQLKIFKILTVHRIYVGIADKYVTKL